MIEKFLFASTPQLHFGAGKLSVLPAEAKAFGSKILLITGKQSFIASAQGASLLDALGTARQKVEHYRIVKEPSPAMIDEAVQKFSPFAPDCVIAIGGGSALDAGKAISAMLPLNAPAKDYLEGVGTKAGHPGVKIPFVAVPTTSGTGSEATKNAVLSETGEHGYKRSLRHNNFVPDLAIVDPTLTLNCPPLTTASSGMDAFTQLLESYLSTESNPLTNTLAFEGLRCVARSLLKAYHQPLDLEARIDMALAAYLSGVALANAGLGVVHGFASSIGGYFEVPHGVICSALMAPANKITVRKLRHQDRNQEALKKYAEVGKIFSREPNKCEAYYVDLLLSEIERWTKEMRIPALSDFAVNSEDFLRIASVTGNKNNPVKLEPEEMIEVLEIAHER